MDISQNIQINVIGNAAVALQQISQQAVVAEGSLRKVQDTVGIFEKLGQKVSACAAYLQGISSPGMQLEQAMADLSAATGIAGRELDSLTEAARRTGRESGVGAAQAAEAFALLAGQVDLGRIGVDGLRELQSSTLTLSQATATSMAEAAAAMAAATEGFALGAGGADRAANVLAATAQLTRTGIGALSEVLRTAGDAASGAGLSLEGTAAAAGILARSGLEGAAAGDALNAVIGPLQSSLGADLSGGGFAATLRSLQPMLADTAALTELFGAENLDAARALIGQANALDELTTRVSETNAAEEMAATRTDTVQQMMARCQARVDDLKIGFFELTGPAGVYLSMASDTIATVSDMLPVFSTLREVIAFVTDAQKMQTLWTNAVSTATSIWTGIQGLFNASLWACPITWIVAGIVALIAVIVVCVTKVQGWGKQWDNIVRFMKLTGELFVESFKLAFEGMSTGILNTIDRIKLGWYKFREAVGIGDSAENQRMIGQLNDDIEGRKQALADHAQKIADLKQQASDSLTWELSWKGGTKEASATDAAALPAPGMPTLSAAAVPAASMAPMAGLPPAQSTESSRHGGLSMERFCDKIEIHIASADGKGYDQIQEEVVAVLEKVMNDYEA